MVAAHSNYNIPQIPGVPLHPKQVEEMERIAELKKDDPTLGTLSQGTGRMPKKTRQLLIELAKMFKEAKPLDATSAKGASLDDQGRERVAGRSNQ
jgi:penicillin-binding protein 1A